MKIYRCESTNGHSFFADYEKKKKKMEFILINIFSPTFVPNLVTLTWTRHSENYNTPQPLDQWTNSPFIGQQVGNSKSFTLTHYLADLFAMHRGPRSIPMCIQHHIQLTSLSFQVSQTSHSWVTAVSIFYLENPRSRSWVRLKSQSPIPRSDAFSHFLLLKLLYLSKY